MYIVDVQGFQYKNTSFICREIAIINIKTGKVFHKYIQLPFDLYYLSNSFGKHIDWTIKNVHGLLWDDELSSRGDKYPPSPSIFSNYLPLECIALYLSKIIKPHEKIFVKGLEKKRWLGKLTCYNNTIVDLLDMGCVNLDSLKKLNLGKKFHCETHHYSNNLLCARENVFLLRNWYIKNKTN